MQWKTITYLKIDDLVDFEAQPFKVVDDEAMHELCGQYKDSWSFSSYNR